MSVSILVVDDEPDIADLFRQRFRREARQGTFVMHFAASGVDALNRLAEDIQPRMAAVLSDINMLGMDGLELLGEIKQRRPDLPVMIVTAYGDDERRRRAAELGEGTQQGAMGPFPPSDRKARFDFGAVFRIEDGKSAEWWVTWDNMTMLRALGHVPTG
jgi:CheY-like chemotaxis protein